MSLPSAVAVAVLRVFLDCSSGFCHQDYLREEVQLAQYVRDRADADVHVLITEAQTGAGGEEFTLTFIGLGAFQSTTRTLTVTTDASDSQDGERRKLASALTVGLLTFLTPDRLPPGLDVTAQLDAGAAPTTTIDNDPWRRWIFSLNGYMNLNSEQSTSRRNWGVSAGADRITPAWKLSIGTQFNERREEFDFDDSDDGDDGGRDLMVLRKNWSFNGLAVKSLNDHWSVGATGHLRSSTFDNVDSDLRLAPAIEWNFFPYSMYTRRQFRVQYSIGGSRSKYYEETLLGKFEETRGREELSATYEQRELWGTLEGRFEVSHYFPGFDNHRFQVDGEANLRVARGLSLNVNASASRIRDQLSLPRRDASPEEVLLELRQLRSNFEARVSFGFEYRFGSAFAAIVNPRFGQ